jgi:hypothetical protein
MAKSGKSMMWFLSENVWVGYTSPNEWNRPWKDYFLFYNFKKNIVEPKFRICGVDLYLFDK